MVKTKSVFLTTTALFIFLITNLAFAGETKTAVFSDDIGIVINGTKFTAPVVLIDKVSYLPISALGYAINANISWDQETRTISVTKQTKPIELNNFSQELGGQSHNKIANFSSDIKLMVDTTPLNSPIVIIEGKSYLPVRALAENIGIDVIWEDSFRVIDIVNPAIAIQDDLLLGKWKGYIEKRSWLSALGEDNPSSRNDFEYFIAKNKDGSYNIIVKETRPNGTYYLAELKGNYDNTSNILEASIVKYILKQGWDSTSYNDDKLRLSGNTLYFVGTQQGKMEKQIDKNHPTNEPNSTRETPSNTSQNTVSNPVKPIKIKQPSSRTPVLPKDRYFDMDGNELSEEEWKNPSEPGTTRPPVNRD